MLCLVLMIKRYLYAFNVFYKKCSLSLRVVRGVLSDFRFDIILHSLVAKFTKIEIHVILFKTIFFFTIPSVYSTLFSYQIFMLKVMSVVSRIVPLKLRNCWYDYPFLDNLKIKFFKNFDFICKLNIHRICMTEHKDLTFEQPAENNVLNYRYVIGH